MVTTRLDHQPTPRAGEADQPTDQPGPGTARQPVSTPEYSTGQADPKSAW
jgi:hypothetical protein